METKTKVKSTILLFITAIVWGFAFVAQRIGADFLGTFSFNGIRFLLGGISLIPVILIFEKEKMTKEKWKNNLIIGFFAGLILFLASSLQQYGIEVTGSAGKAGFLTGLYTVMVPLFRFIGGKKTNPLTFVGSIFAVAGLFLLCMNGNDMVFGKGDIILISCAVFFALHIILVDKFVNKLSPLKFSMIQFFVCGIISMSIALYKENITLSAVNSALIPLIYGGIMSVGVAYTCQIVGQKDADPTFASIVLSTESMFGAIGGAVILHEIMTGRGYLGCVFIFIGIILSQLNLEKITKKVKK